MKKRVKLVNLDCASCAAKMEEAIKRINGIDDVSVNFMMQKMTIDADDSIMEDVMKSVITVCKRIEPDCQIIY